MAQFLAIFIILSVLSTHFVCFGADILFLAPFPVKSHWYWLEHFVRHLLNKGHHLTTLTNFPTKEPHKNLTEVIISPMFDIPAKFPKSHIFEMQYSNDFNNINLVKNAGSMTAEYALNNPKVKALIANKKLKFDLIILEQFYHESFLMFAHKFKCPIITIGTLTYADSMDHAMGVLSPWAIAPHLMLTYSARMSFKERAYNALASLYDNYIHHYVHIPKMHDMAVRHFKGHVDEPMPHIRDLEKNISFMFINSHRATDAPRPHMPGIIDVGGAHIKPAKPLPVDLQKFLDKSTNGAIYFSLGSYVEGSDMPPAKINLFLKAFSKLKQNVLWKFENSTIGNLPPNVMIYKWMPQNDVLAHPNVKVFMTHSGVFGTQEGIYWGKPMLCIPLYGDQHRNSLKAVRNGFARALNFAVLTEEDIIENLSLLIKDPNYLKKAKELSARFRENPIHPLEETAHWIDHTIRHGGAEYLKSSGVHLTWYQFLMLDVLACCLAVIFVALFVIIKVLRIIVGLLKGNKNKSDQKKKKN